MAIKISLDIRRRFDVVASMSDVYEVLADVPCSASHYPQVAELDDLDDGVYRWEFESIGVAGMEHVVVYACHYDCDSESGRVTWEPEENIGNTRVAGSWILRSRDDGTRVEFHTIVSLNIAAPRFLAAIVTPFVEATFERQVDQYIANLTATFGGTAS